jgi:hypothetical protein
MLVLLALSLLSGAILVRWLESAAPVGAMPRPEPARAVADRLGVAHVGGKYHLTDQDFLNEGADQLLSLGTRVIKAWFVGWSTPDNYDFNSRWPRVRSMVELAKTPYYQSLFEKPFSTFILEAYAFGREDDYWRTGITDRDAADETRQFEELTTYLLKTYQGTGKTFILQTWEGDHAIRGDYTETTVPTERAISGMIRWLNARQEGVERGRRAAPVEGCRVYHAAEVNYVAMAMEGRATVASHVVPHTRCDLYSYSAYDTCVDGKRFRATLDYLAAQAPDSAAFGARNVYIGEFGIPENEYGTPASLAATRRTVQEALAWGCPYVVYWQLYDNECRRGKSDEPGDCPGFWLIKPSGKKSALWGLMRDLLRSPAR